jgi:serine phosphatase RsbU (regulator of sigma subunit)
MVKDGRLVDVDVTVWPTRDLDGTITGASAIVRDISDLKRAKRKLTQLYEQQRHVALTLQTALMGTPPRIPEIETAHRYLPATGGAGVGGDLFDLIPLGAGRARVFVGDVMGRGPEAAAVAGQVRSAARSLAKTQLPPQLMQALDAFAADLPQQLITCCYLVIDPGPAAGPGLPLTICSAGHPPALLVPPGPTALPWPGSLLRSACRSAWARSRTSRPVSWPRRIDLRAVHRRASRNP